MMKNSRSRLWLYDVMFLLILLMAAYFRLSGLNWDQSQHLHPDERFLTMVESAMTPVKDLGAYFDTEHSTLNPHNIGYGFYVYGDLPIIIVRYAAEWMSGLSKWAADNVQANGTDGFFGPAMAVLGPVALPDHFAALWAQSGGAGGGFLSVGGHADPAVTLFYCGYVCQFFHFPGNVFCRGSDGWGRRDTF